MTNTIRNLQDKTNQISMHYLQGYNNGPIIGMRSVETVFVDDIFWLVCGDITSNGKSLHTIAEVEKADIDNLSVSLSAQAIIEGSIVMVHLGTHKVTSRTNINSDKGMVVLA